MKQNKCSSGLTLIEVILYIAISNILITGLLLGIIQFSSSTQRSVEALEAEEMCINMAYKSTSTENISCLISSNKTLSVNLSEI